MGQQPRFPNQAVKVKIGIVGRPDLDDAIVRLKAYAEAVSGLDDYIDAALVAAGLPDDDD